MLDNSLNKIKIPRRVKQPKKSGMEIFKSTFKTLLILLIIFGVLYGVYFFYTQTINKVSKVSPIYSIYADNGTKIYKKSDARWIETGDNFNLIKGDTLGTGMASRTVLGYRDVLNIRLTPSSLIKYVDEENDTLIIGIEQGRMWLETWGGKFRIETPRGSISIEQGVAEVKIEKTDRVSIFCHGGKLDITTGGVKNNNLTLGQEEKVFIDNNDEISAISRISKEYDRWQSWNLSFSGKRLRVGEVPPPYALINEEEKPEIAVTSKKPVSIKKPVAINKPVRSVKKQASKSRKTTASDDKVYTNVGPAAYPAYNPQGGDQGKYPKSGGSRLPVTEYGKGREVLDYKVEAPPFKKDYMVEAPPFKKDYMVEAPPFKKDDKGELTPTPTPRPESGVYGHTNVGGRSAIQYLHNENVTTRRQGEDATDILDSSRPR